MSVLSIFFLCSIVFPQFSIASDRAAGSSSGTAGVQVIGAYGYAKPELFTFIKNQPSDFKDFGNVTFRKESVPALALVAVGTGLLIAADQTLYEKTYALGDRWNISHRGQQKAVLSMSNPFISGKKLNILSLPNDLGSAMYFIGDGWLHLGIAGGFLAYGLADSDNRALQTSGELAEAIVANGIVVQALKHITGRENPSTLTVPGGKWRFFPNQIDYHKHVSKYDAFPSGHLPTALITVTVIAENYPEYNFIRPLGYSLLALLSFQMVNNGVHWYSDYPLALYTGYTFAEIAVRRGRTVESGRGSRSFEMMPTIVGGALGLAVRRRF